MFNLYAVLNQIHSSISNYSNQQDMKKTSDSLLQKYIKSYELKNVNLKCKCSSPIEDLCLQNCGEPSPHCRNKLCKNSSQKHKICRVLKLQGLTELLEQRFECNKLLLKRIQQIQQDFIANIRKEREQIYNKFLFREFQGEEIITLEQIFIRKSVDKIKGTQIEDIYKKLLSQIKLKEENEKELKQFQNQFGKLVTKISEIRQTWIKQALNKPNLLAVSNIMNNKQIQQSIFVLNCLNNPKELKLLFRASQHQFSAAKFHQICDGIPNLLVLVKTQFGKVIGGFNSIGWNIQLHDKQSADTQNRCFIFSVTLRQKMDLIRPQNAIHNLKQYGPLFGYYCDIGLSDKCNQNKNSGSHFPSSYNFKSKPYKKIVQTNKLFSGSSSKNFNVAEYEVFLVVK